MHKLKKYPNRRLYDTTDSKYVTIEDVRKLIVKGESIEVADSKDGEDITRSVLLQILSEQESEGHEPILTNRAIEQIIRFYGDTYGRVVSRYIEQSMLTFIEHQDQYRNRIRALNDLNPLSFMRQAFEKSMSEFTRAATRATGASSRSDAPPKASTPGGDQSSNKPDDDGTVR